MFFRGCETKISILHWKGRKKKKKTIKCIALGTPHITMFLNDLDNRTRYSTPSFYFFFKDSEHADP